MPNRRSTKGSLLCILVVVVSVSQATEGDTRPLSSHDTELLDTLLSGPKGGHAISGFSGIADSLAPIQKTKGASNFHIRVANAVSMKSRKREGAQDEGSERKVRKRPRHRLPTFFIVQSSSDNDAVRGPIPEAHPRPDSSKALGDLGKEHPTIFEQIMRGKREKKNISPLILIIHRRMVQNKTANATVGANRTEVTSEPKNQTAESSRRRREFAIDVIKKIIFNKILSSSRRGIPQKPGNNASSYQDMTAPALFMRKLPLAAESIHRDTGPNMPSFGFSFDVQVVKYNDDELVQEVDPLAFGSGDLMPEDMMLPYLTLLVLAMIVLPLPIIGLFLVYRRHFKTTTKRRLITNPFEATFPASGSKTTDVRVLEKPMSITICTNTPCPGASQPTKYTFL